MHVPGPRSNQDVTYLGLALALAWSVACDTPSAPRRATPKPSLAVPAAQQAVAATPPASPRGEQFGDLTMVKLAVTGFDDLSLRERALLFCFQQALASGRDVAFAQRFEGNLAVRRTLEAVLETYRGNRKTPAFEQLREYAGRVFFAEGIHHPVSGAKLSPEMTASEFAALVQESDASNLPLQPGQSVAAWLEHLTPVLFSPAIAPHLRAPEGDDPLSGPAGALYGELGASEANAFYAGGDTPTRHPHNARLQRRGGQVVEEVYRVDGLYGAALARVVQWLDKAAALAQGTQRESLEALSRHFTTGDPAEFERYVALWRAEQDARVDLAMGFIDRSLDPLGRRGAFAGVASFAVDAPDVPMHALLAHAGALEAALPLPEGDFRPWDDETGAPPRTMQAVVGGGSFATRLPTSLQLGALVHGPQGRRRYLNVAQARREADPATLGVADLALAAREQRRARAHGPQAQSLFDALRETLGYGVGALPKGAPDPASALREHAAIVVEARADLVALHMAFDDRLIELGQMPSFEVSRALYDDYVRRALLSSLPLLSSEAPGVNPRLLAMRLVVQWARALDPPDAPSVQRVLKEGDTYFVIADYIALRRRFGRLLAELQRILAAGDYAAADALVTGHALPLEPALRAQVEQRLAAHPPTGLVGLVQPRLVADYEGDDVRDVRLHYPTDAIGQALEDSRRFGFLPAFSE